MTAASFANQLTDNAAETDEHAESTANPDRARVAELLHDPAQRDPDMWTDAFTDLGLDPNWAAFSLHDMVTTFDRFERDPTWHLARQAIETVAKVQTFAESSVRDVMTMAEQQAQALKRVSNSDARAVAKAGISKDELDAAKERRRAGPTNVPG